MPKITHWMSNTKFYRVFKELQNRCRTHKDYAWRWIRCEWNTFEEFYKDMFDSYRQWLSIDRKDNDWNYSKRNCRWVTMKIQSWNRRNSIRYKWKCLKHWCEELWVNQFTIKSRIKNWWELKEAIFTPIWKTGHSIRK